MHKVLCERPRSGGGWIKQRRRANRTEDQLPKQEGIKRHYFGGSKMFGEHLGPLKRWLRSKVGCDWNAVYSEAAKVIKPDSVVRAHIRFHMLEMVERNTFMRGGEVWCIRHGLWQRPSEMPIRELLGRRDLFYVHPESGVLLAIPDRPRGLTLREQEEKEFSVVKRWLPKDFLLLKLKGHWFECRMVRYQAHWQFAPVDFVFGSQLIDSHAREAYGEPVYCSRKRQLSRKELRARGLTNSKSAADCFLNVLGDDLIGRIRRSHGNPTRCWLQFRISLWIEASAGQFLSYIKFSFWGHDPVR
jgi:hypothetical protein